MTDVINLYLSNGNVLVWSANDWYKLRTDHRIVGELIGCLSKLPRQDILNGLPLLLLPEEVTLLVEKGIARVVQCAALQRHPDENLQKSFNEYKELLFVEQEKCFQEGRKKQIVAMMDKIVEGKKQKVAFKRKMNEYIDETKEKSETTEIDKDELLKKELSKLPKLDKSNVLVQTHTACPWISEDDLKVIDWCYPIATEHVLTYNIFKNLWEKGYYVTSGEKFGGDFLAYPGDPIAFHSQFIIQCISKDEAIPLASLIGQSRMSCHVRKTFVYASLSETGQISYQSIRWIDSTIQDDN